MPSREISNNNLRSELESLLFITNRPLKKKELANFFKTKVNLIDEEIKKLIDQYSSYNKGIKILDSGEEVQMITNPKNAQAVKDFLKIEVNKELTPASLETLSIIAYRGPITEEELSAIRGVNCAIIIRHLLVKGLIIEKKENQKTFYQVSLDFLSQLGINDLKELPDWQKLNRDVPLEELKQREL